MTYVLGPRMRKRLQARRMRRRDRLEDVPAEELERPETLHEFVRAAWPLVVPNAPFIDNWHIGAICEHLEAQSKGGLDRLAINVPPGSSKSTIVGVMWQAWEWTWNPFSQWMFGAYGQSLSVRDTIKARNLVTSEWYRRRWGDVWSPAGTWKSNELHNDKGGKRFAVSVGSAATGQHAHRQVVDDPVKAADAHSMTALETAKSWWFETMASRMLPGGSMRNLAEWFEARGRAVPGDNTRTIIMQRLHDYDLSGIAEEQGYTVLRIPMVWSEATYRATTSIGWTDPRTEDGQLLCPERWDQAEVDRRSKEFGPDGWAAQDQQDPIPAGGAIYREEWLRQFYTVVPRPYDLLKVISVDCAFKDHDTSSKVALQCWGAAMPDFYLLARVCEHMDFLATIGALRAMHARFPDAAVLVEDKANGPAVMAVLKQEIPGIIPIEPDGSKVARAFSTQPYFHAGNVWLPDPSIDPTIHEFIQAHRRFPKGAFDDDVDAQSQALRYFNASGVQSWVDAYANQKQ